MFLRKSILTKMIAGTVVPAILLISIALFVVINITRSALIKANIESLSANADTISAKTEDFLNTNAAFAESLASNPEIQAMLLTTPVGKKLIESEYVDIVTKTLKSVVDIEPDTILQTWNADFDSNTGFDSTGTPFPDGFDMTSRPWYKVTETKSTVVTDPYIDVMTGKLVTTLASPIFDESGNVIGALGVDLTVDGLSTSIQQHKIGKNGVTILVSKNGVVISAPEKDFVGKNIAELDIPATLKDSVQSKKVGDMKYAFGTANMVGYLSLVGGHEWVTIASIPETQFEDQIAKTTRILLLIFISGTTIVIAITLLTTLGIVRPIKKLAVAANEIADGKLDVTLNVKSIDETGKVASAFNRTIVRLKDYMKYIDEISSVLNQIAEGNFDFDLEYDYVGEFSKIKESLLHISTTLSQTMLVISQTAEQVSSGSMQVASGSQLLAAGATEQASSTEELSATMYTINQQIQANATNSSKANEIAQESLVLVQQGNEQMQTMISAMNDINTSSNQIAQIIKTIDDIAFQTNILALNAAVEAARAGTAGKGFAVVADEVRTLASRCAEAAKMTTELIEASIASVNDGTQIASQTAESLNAIVAITNEISGLISEISTSSNEQASSMMQINQGVEQISAVVQTNSATAEQSAAASEELSSQAQILKEEVKKFKLKSSF